jgi:hypothetical protein
VAPSVCPVVRSLKPKKKVGQKWSGGSLVSITLRDMSTFAPPRSAHLSALTRLGIWQPCQCHTHCNNQIVSRWHATSPACFQMLISQSGPSCLPVAEAGQSIDRDALTHQKHRAPVQLNVQKLVSQQAVLQGAAYCSVDSAVQADKVSYVSEVHPSNGG